MRTLNPEESVALDQRLEADGFAAHAGSPDLVGEVEALWTPTGNVEVTVHEGLAPCTRQRPTYTLRPAGPLHFVLESSSGFRWDFRWCYQVNP